MQYQLQVLANNVPIPGVFVQAIDANSNPMYVGSNPLGTITDANGNAVIASDAPIAFLQAQATGFAPASVAVTGNSINSLTLTPTSSTVSTVKHPALGGLGTDPALGLTNDPSLGIPAINPATTAATNAANNAAAAAAQVQPQVQNLTTSHVILWVVVIIVGIIVIFKWNK